MLKKYLINAILIYSLFCNIFAQIPQINIDRLTNSQLDDLREAVNPSDQIDLDESAITNELMQSSESTIIQSNQDAEMEDSIYFGYNYFRRDINFFDNIPTPLEYKLGPGDEIILSLWGETNLREKFIINKDGLIYYSNVGFINLSNKNLKEAETLLIEELSSIYSTLKDKNNSTELMIELGQLKSVNVYFSGHIENPGINLVHPFSDIFTAIIQAGGINENGSLREVQLIRNEKIINTIDFYHFFMSGKNTFSDVKLIDGDIIHIPNFKNRIEITGEVNRPSTYELLPNESISNIITYASGLTSDASSNLILNQISPPDKRSSDDYARTSKVVNLKNSELVILNNGDTINVISIQPVDSEVTVYGRVKVPGSYPAYKDLKHILNIAGGFDDPTFRQTIKENEIIVLRQDSEEFYSKEIILSYESSDKFLLKPNDKIFVYEDINYRNSFTYRVEGEVLKPGTYPLKRGLTVGKALNLAGGLTELSSLDNIAVFQDFTELDSLGNETTFQQNVSNADLNFELGSNSVIKATPFENVVRVEGNVYDPGLVAYTRGLTLSKAIIQSGGYMPNSMKKRVYVKKANGEIDKANLFRGRAKRLDPGDSVIVPVDPDPDDFDLTTFIADLSTTLANIAAILLIVDNNSN